MLYACSGHDKVHQMSAIQIKNVPPELHARLRERARQERRSLSEYTLSVLERNLALPSTREWLQRLSQDEPVTGITSEDIVRSISEARAERNEQLLRSLADSD
jgi:plasmid stability protein